MASALSRIPDAVARPLAWAGVVDREAGGDVVELALPVMVTGGMRTLLRAVDLLMVSLALGEAAVGGLEIGFQYYFLGFGTALGLSSGTISLVARAKGAGADEEADLAVKVSLLLALMVAVPLTAATWLFAEPMIALLADDAATVLHGGAYLRWVMLGFSFRFWGMVASRALAGAGDTRTPMRVRVVTVPLNAVFNLVFIFGFGPLPAYGAAGAGMGTTLANALAGLAFLVLLGGGLRDVALPLTRPHWDGGLAREVLRVGSPLAGVQIVRTVGRFPYLFVLALLGTSALSAYAIGRQIMLLALMPAWGYATAASTLVGQSVGAGDLEAASAHGWDSTRVALATQVLVGLVLVAFADPIVALFGVADPGLHVLFLQAFGLAVPAYAVGRTLRGALRGAGDAVVPFLAATLGTVLRLPIAFAALAPGVFVVPMLGVDVGLGLGVGAAIAAFVVDMWIRGGIVAGRWATGGWRGVASAPTASEPPP
jgi:putative MATE family efflux protein